jgi:hypothetical protein
MSRIDVGPDRLDDSAVVWRLAAQTLGAAVAELSRAATGVDSGAPPLTEAMGEFMRLWSNWMRDQALLTTGVASELDAAADTYRMTEAAVAHRVVQPTALPGVSPAPVPSDSAGRG